MILQYKLRDLIKIYDDFANDPIKGDFSEDFVTIIIIIIIGRKRLVEYKLLWLHKHIKAC